MKSLKENLLGGEAAEQLPRTRREAFVFYGKQQFWKLLICGALTSLFFVPLLGWLYAMNYVKAQAIAALDVGAAIVYACCGDWKHMTYWLAAATLTATVTF